MTPKSLTPEQAVVFSNEAHEYKEKAKTARYQADIWLKEAKEHEDAAAALEAKASTVLKGWLPPDEAERLKADFVRARVSQEDATKRANDLSNEVNQLRIKVERLSDELAHRNARG